MDYNSLLNLFVSNNYYVSVYPDIDSNACLVEYPQRTCVKPIMDGLTCVYCYEDFNETYQTSGISYVSTTFTSQIVEDSSSILETNIFIPCPNYAARTIAYYDIYCKTTNIQLYPEMMLLLNKKGLGEATLSLYDIFKIKLSKKDMEKEAKLAGFMFLTIENKEDDFSAEAIEEDILEGYRLFNTVPL